MSSIRQFLADETTGPRDVRHGGWLLVVALIANEVRGIVVAYEGARLMGWI